MKTEYFAHDAIMNKPIKYGREWERTEESLPKSAWLIVKINGDEIYASEETGYIYLLRKHWDMKLYKCPVGNYPQK